MDLDLSRLAVFPSAPDEVVKYLREGMPALLETIKQLGGIQQSTTVAPVKPDVGALRYADGTNWNPGQGSGFYLFDGTNWSLLVNSTVQAVTGSVVLTAARRSVILSTPSAAYTQALPTTGVKKYDEVYFKNLSATAGRNITINSSGGNLVWLTCPGNECALIALQDAPTTAAHWEIINRGWPIHARVHKSADQSDIANNTAVKVTFDTVLTDPAAMFSDANDRFVLPLPGIWEVLGSVTIEGDTGHITRAGIYLNGAETPGGDASYFFGTTLITAKTIVKPIAQIAVTTPGTDYVELWMANSSDVPGNADIVEAEAGTIFDGNKSTWFSVKYLGPF